MQTLLAKEVLSSGALETLLLARERGEVAFLLVDVREQSEYDAGHIKGVDMLRPTSLISHWAGELLSEAKGQTIVFTCRTGARSGGVQAFFKERGHAAVVNHTGGIFSYKGTIER